MTHQFREDGSHYNGGAEFFGYRYRAIGEPRLKMIRRWYKASQRRGLTEDRYFVDGAHVEDYAAAVEALKKPVLISDAEVQALRLIGDEPADCREMVEYVTLRSLADKGAIEWGPPGRCRRTHLGRTAVDVAARA